MPQAQRSVKDSDNHGSVNSTHGLFVNINSEKIPFAQEKGGGNYNPDGSTVVSVNTSEQPSSKKIFYLGCILLTVGGIGAPITFINKTPGAGLFGIAAFIGLLLLCISYFMMEKQERAELCSSPCCSK